MRMTVATACNYPRFSHALGEPGLDDWLKHGPHPGDPAPDFELEDLDGKLPPGSESVEMPQVASRVAVGLRLLERRGRSAVLDFYRSAPPPLQVQLGESTSEPTRSVIEQEE